MSYSFIIGVNKKQNMLMDQIDMNLEDREFKWSVIIHFRGQANTLLIDDSLFFYFIFY